MLVWGLDVAPDRVVNGKVYPGVVMLGTYPVDLSFSEIFL